MNNQPDDHSDRLTAAFGATRAEAQALPSAAQQTHARAQFLLDASNRTVSSQSKQPTPKRFYSRLNRMIAAVLLGIIIAGGFWATPTLRVLAQEILNLMVPGSSDSVQEVIQVSAPVSVHTLDNPYPLTIAELVAQANFDLRLPTYLPAHYHFAGAAMIGSDPLALLSYQCDPLWSLAIIQRHGDDTTVQSFEVGTSAVIESVAIHAATGQYVRGTWYEEIPGEIFNHGNGTPQVVNAQRFWTNNTEFQYLKWKEDGINFTIQTGSGNQLRLADPPCALTKDDYTAVAQSLQPAASVK